MAAFTAIGAGRVDNGTGGGRAEDIGWLGGREALDRSSYEADKETKFGLGPDSDFVGLLAGNRGGAEGSTGTGMARLEGARGDVPNTGVLIASSLTSSSLSLLLSILSTSPYPSTLVLVPAEEGDGDGPRELVLGGLRGTGIGAGTGIGRGGGGIVRDFIGGVFVTPVVEEVALVSRLSGGRLGDRPFVILERGGKAGGRLFEVIAGDGEGEESRIRGGVGLVFILARDGAIGVGLIVRARDGRTMGGGEGEAEVFLGRYSLSQCMK